MAKISDILLVGTLIGGGLLLARAYKNITGGVSLKPFEGLFQSQKERFETTCKSRNGTIVMENGKYVCYERPATMTYKVSQGDYSNLSPYERSLLSAGEPIEKVARVSAIRAGIAQGLREPLKVPVPGIPLLGTITAIVTNIKKNLLRL